MTSTQIPVVITYHRPGTHPPLYIAGTFSNPPWQPYEMDHTVREDGEYDFKKEVHGEPGSKIQYKFRIGNGDWWVLKDDGPTVTDGSGNTNHVLEVKADQEQGTQGADSDGGSGRPLSYAKVASKHLQPSSGQTSTDRSATGTPITAKVAAEVADSAELLHEEVPEREKDEAGVDKQTERRMSEEAETAAEVADSAQALDGRQGTIVILEPPPGEGNPFSVRPRGAESPGDEDGYITDKSPLFSHECAGMYESDGELGEDEGGEEDLRTTHVESFGPQMDLNKVDLNDPTLERFPSSRGDIMDAVRKLESGLPVDPVSFEGGNYRSPVLNPSRRGTEDITGDFSLASAQTSSPQTQRPPRKASRGSISSVNPAASLHSISEGDEPGEELSAEDESISRPAVVFSNPLKAKPKHLKIPTSDEDEGVALREGVSPRTVKPPRPAFMTSEASTHSPPSPTAARKGGPPHDETDNLAPAETKLHKGRKRLEEVKLHPAPPGDLGGTHPGSSQTDVPKPGKHSPTESPTSNDSNKNWTAASQPSGLDRTSDTKGASSQAPHNRRPSYAEIAASQPPRAEPPPEKKKTKTLRPLATEDRPVSKSSPSQSSPSQSSPSQSSPSPSSPSQSSPSQSAPPQPANSSDSKIPAPGTGARRPSYAEATASKSSSTDDKAKATTSVTAESSASASTTTTALDTDTGMGTGQDSTEPADLRRRGGARDKQPAATTDDATVPAAQFRREGGWMRAVFRLVFVDFFGGFVRRVLRMLRIGWVLAVLGGRRRDR
ncbi:hypothetical protein CHGG_02854 [Chaetomium globosum CBS 148.51]|uniref:AMP-activated protein kinase glycogen-binding domain-containing protein n=1 Tax=Chaetomium globosum (strain ATCC 6205 / CBS 148.51 / DSM 1962 / NBRC 6347 / NRRL 1970) TaxID=306901 RepID=Q2HAA0_CHAGB|nr:uncharacterized protein CHGG_02854 [Chaetomium globosum CBS 148.51]EAQ90919.1 hypothetical protein CHGG_02854 [Chaetomium globosum CBS 148.51]